MPNTPTMRYTKGHPESQMIEVHWTYTLPDEFTGDPYVEVYRNEDGGAYSKVKTFADHHVEYYYDYGVSNNVTYGYKVRRCDDSGCSSFSGSSTLTLFADTGDETIELDEDTTDSTVVGDSTTDTIELDESASGAGVIVDSTTDGITLLDSPGDIFTLTLETNYGYYFGDFNGKIYYESEEYGSDAGTAIEADWYSKVTDFADIDGDALGKFKTVYKARLFYVDHTAGQSVTMSVSTDGGTTWTSAGRNVGTGDGTIKSADFFFIKTGDVFQFWLSHNDDQGKFQWINFEVFYSIGGAYFEI